MSFEETHPTGQNNIKIVKFNKRKNNYLYIYEPQTRKVGYSSMGSYDLEYCKKNWFKVYQEYVDKGNFIIQNSATPNLKNGHIYMLEQYYDNVDKDALPHCLTIDMSYPPDIFSFDFSSIVDNNRKAKNIFQYIRNDAG